MSEQDWDTVTYLRKKQPKTGQLKSQQVSYNLMKVMCLMIQMQCGVIQKGDSHSQNCIF